MIRHSPVRFRRAAPWALIALLAAPALIAQGGGGFRARSAAAIPIPRNLPYDGRFTFARLRYTVASGGYYYRGLPAWAHGYSHAEENLLKITHEMSYLLDGHLDGSNVLAIDDPQLFKFPVAYMTEAGYWVMSDDEALALRKYLLKGGFLILDDTRDGFSPGNMGMANIENELRADLPRAAFRAISRSRIRSFIRSSTSSRSTSCRSTTIAARRSFPRLFVDNDPQKRIMVLLNFNTDVSNFWEFSATGFQVVAGSNEAYKLGVNYLIYALTH